VTDTATEPEAGLFEEKPPEQPRAQPRGGAGSRDCPECGKVFNPPMAAARLGQHRKKDHGVAPAGKGLTEEKAPQEKGAQGDGKKEPTPKGRQNLSTLGEYIFEGLSWVSAKTGRMAASRMYRIHSAAFGPALEKSAKGTFLDKILQPAARLANQSPETAALVMGPITAEAFLASPSPLTQGAFVAAVSGSVPAVIRAGKTKLREQAKLEADLSAFAQSFGKAEGERVTLEEYANFILFGNINGPQEDPPPNPDDVPVEAEVVA